MADPVCAVMDCTNPPDPEGWVEIVLDGPSFLPGQQGPVLVRAGICAWHDQAIGNSLGTAFTLKALATDPIEC